MNKEFAFIFPGQGSQSLGMLADLAAVYPVVAQTFAEASAILDYDLWQLTLNGPDSELNLTHKTQPAMLAAGVAMWRIWQSQSPAIPRFMAGHSLGEYTALVCAGALKFSDAINLVALRGRFMQEAVPANTGAMAALLGLADDKVSEVCSQAAQGEVVAAANFNSPGQVVIAGHATAVERAVQLAKAAGAKRAIMLPVSVPSHCALMQAAAQHFAQHLNETPLKAPSIPVINNVDVAVCSSPDAIRDALTRQLYLPVRWSEVINKMALSGVTTLVECGPGKVLSGLNKRINPALKSLSLHNLAGLEQALAGDVAHNPMLELEHAAK
ncbi:MAG: ACP S-malonyltransferase [Gammaproteobacteria bacterium]